MAVWCQVFPLGPWHSPAFPGTPAALEVVKCSEQIEASKMHGFWKRRKHGGVVTSFPTWPTALTRNFCNPCVGQDLKARA